jgi:polar amino acid transport system substrate-binding protein
MNVTRRLLVAVVGAVALLAGCGASPTTAPSSTGTSGSPTASANPCTPANLQTLMPGTLTIGTDNPAYPPYFSGGTDTQHPEWKLNDPYTGKGFEDAVAYAVADRLGYTQDTVTWVVAPFNQTYKPGPTQWDFAIEQISYTAKRAQAVDFSQSYYDVNQALVAVKGTPIAQATSVSELRGYRLAAPIGTSSYDYIVNAIQPTKEAGSYQTLSDTVAALNAHQVDGIVVDLPTALFIADPNVQEVKNSTVVGQFPTAAGSSEYFAMTLRKGSPLVACVNQALSAMKSDGTLASITNEWLSQKTNVGSVPVFSTS